MIIIIDALDKIYPLLYQLLLTTPIVDYNLNQEAIRFYGIIASRGWLEIVSIQLVTFAEERNREHFARIAAKPRRPESEAFRLKIMERRRQRESRKK